MKCRPARQLRAQCIMTSIFRRSSLGKDELAVLLNSFVGRWGSSSKTLRLTVGSGAFNWRTAADRLPVSIDVSDVAFSSAAGRQPLVANVVDPLAWHSARFAEVWIASLVPTFLVGYQFASRRQTASQVLGARRSPFAVVRPRPVLPSRGPAAHPQGRRATAPDRMGMVHLNRRVREAQSFSKRRMESRRSARQASLSHSDNGRLSTPWREVIFLFTVIDSIFELSSPALV